MTANGGTPFVFGDIGTFLAEKVMRNERCQFCGNAISAGDVVQRLGCNHIAHWGCFDTLDGSFSCGQRHTIDGRYQLRIVVQPDSTLNKRTGSAQAFAEQISRKSRFDPPVISDADRDRLLGAGPSSAAAVAPPPPPPLPPPLSSFELQPLGAGPSSAPPPPPPPLSPPPLSPFELQPLGRFCFACYEDIPPGRAAYFHPRCYAFFCFGCINRSRTACPSCNERAGVGSEIYRV